MDGVEVTIRRAIPADAEALAELAVRTFRDTFAEDNRPENMADYMDRAYGPGQQLAEIESGEVVTLLVGGDRPVAFAQLRHATPPGCVSGVKPVELWRFYVDGSCHGRGVAGRLMGAVFEAAAGASAIWLGVWERNPRAIAFYGKFGFVDVGAREFRLGADVQTDRVMVREMGADPSLA